MRQVLSNKLLGRAAGLLALAGFVLLLALAGCNKDSHSHYLEAQDLQRDQKFGPALEEYQKALDLDPKSRMAMFGKAVCLYKLGKFSEAEPLFEKFITDTEPERASFKAER